MATIFKKSEKIMQYGIIEDLRKNCLKHEPLISYKVF